jgi:hypothetical protein
MKEPVVTNGMIEVMKWLLGEVKETMQEEMAGYNDDSPYTKDWSVELSKLETVLKMLDSNK